MCLKFLGSSGMCLGGLRKSLGATSVNVLSFFRMVQEVSGKVQEGPGSPPDPLKSYVCFHKNVIV